MWNFANQWNAQFFKITAPAHRVVERLHQVHDAGWHTYTDG